MLRSSPSTCDDITGRERLFQILAPHRDWQLYTVITSDRPLSELDGAVAPRTLARMLEHGPALDVQGRDLRRRR